MRRRIISKTDNTVLMPPSSNRIKYTTSDNKIINIFEISEHKNIISNTYVEDFGGIIELDGILTDMYPRLFSNKITLTGVTLPNTLHYIAFATFEYCQGLEEAIISNNIINIYKQAFAGCINLKKIHIGRSVERIGYEDGSESLDEYSVFLNCPNISEITVDPTNIIYSDGSDSGGANIILDKNTKTVLVGCKNSIIPTSAFIIGYYAFSECSGMVSITIPSNILEIKKWAFYECSDLRTIIFESTTPATIPADSNHRIFNDKLEKILVPHESVDLYKESWPNYADKIFSKDLFINYTTSDGNIITPAKTNAFGDAQIVSNTYSNGLGIIELDKPCTVLKDGAFVDITTLTSFKIPESVTSIEKSIFYNTGIEEIYIPKNVTTLGENVLRNMYSLKKIVVDPRNTVFDSRDNCNAIIKTSTNKLLSCCKETVIPESVKIIGVRAYQGVQVENFTIPNWIIKLESYAFGWCDKLKSIEIPNSVTSIGTGAFSYCYGLKEVHISDLAAWCGISFDDSGANPLYYAKNLYLNGELVTEVIVPDGVTEIKNYTFYNCTGLTNVEISNSITSIGEYVFNNCIGLTSIEIPNSVTSIGGSAFSNCSGLTSITIPNSVTSIKGSTFYGCSGLEYIKVESNNVTYDSRDNCNAIIETATNTLLKGCQNTVIPNSITRIGGSAFYNCTRLTGKLIIPDSVTSIGSSAFAGCSGLTSITIGYNVSSIDSTAFGGCTNIKYIYCKSITPPTLGYNAFFNNPLNTIYVPYDSVDAYKTSNDWKNYAKKIVGYEEIHYTTSDNNVITPYVDNAFGDAKIISNTYSGDKGTIILDRLCTVIGKNAFNGKKTLTSITIPKNVTSIGSSAFYNCSALAGIEIPNSITSIGGSAFYKCSALTSIEIPNSVTSIGGYAFYNCAGLTNVVIGDGVTSIGYEAFRDCGKIKTLIFGNSVTSIGGYAFCNCSGLVDVTIPKSVTSIGDRAFCGGAQPVFTVDPQNTVYDSRENCGAIIETKTNTLITGNKRTSFIPSSVTSIGNYAFYFSGISKITIPTNLTNIGYGAFDGCSSLKEVHISDIAVWCSTNITGTIFSNAKNLNLYLNDELITNLVIPDGVTEIKKNVFNYSKGLTSVTIPNSVTSIGSDAFFYCTGLTSVTIGNSVTSIGEYAFAYCSGITSLIIKATIPPTIGTSTFNNVNKSIPVYVPSESVNTYKSAQYWSSFTNIQQVDV